ncbi:uncharacterized protein BP01DRAFT_299267 [Aspergillus saccharolyticus JOP 1030-1]|uniref:Uncharacterized protein n=1 Tax=Aspergillus saccharolyticus JOP 1030-1 TaxID=1450539 RepID=A0A318Z9Z5_9EURO|nr:hypothetical protein BP01DRAFT_299267 [Aspergillus saccharolyticus JOP 1030-1]PYH44069.1 hypothetical protein BP01DRAFT_299267 [Aspergillus saccharolyticus JOP 1030-1]
MNLFTLFTSLTCIFLFAITLASPLHTNATTTLFQYSTTGTWLENIALGPPSTNTLLVTRMDVPELWAVDTIAHNATRVATFPNATACMGITPVDEGIYAVVAGSLVITDIGHPVEGSWSVYTVDVSAISDGEAPVRKVVDLREAGWLNGMTLFPDRVVLIADSVNGVIWQLDARTGEYSVALNDTASMAASPTDPLGLGVNGVRVWKEYVYYSTDSRSAVFRVPVGWEKTTKRVVAAGPVETVAQDVVVDDFAVAEDGTLYLMAIAENEVVRVTVDAGKEVLVGAKERREVAGCTSAVVSRDGRRLWVTTNGGHIVPAEGGEEPAKVVEVVLE